MIKTRKSMADIRHPLPAQERLRDLLDYNPDTGHFTWRQDKGRIKAGSRAGYALPNGYWMIRVDMTKYFAHRLVWKYVHGNDPITVDHINHNKSDNRLCNLREANYSQQLANTRKMSRGANPHKGVYLEARTLKYYSVFNYYGEQIWVGTFDNPDDAQLAYAKKHKEYFGEFAKAA